MLRNQSKHVYWVEPGSNKLGFKGSGVTFTAVDTPSLASLSGGADGSTVTDGQLQTAYEKFQDSETVDVGLIIGDVQVVQHTR